MQNTKKKIKKLFRKVEFNIIIILKYNSKASNKMLANPLYY